MKDNRTVIPLNTEIKGSNGQQQVVFFVQDLIGRGGSCMVYNAIYIDTYGVRHNCILKQLFPLRIATDNPIHWENVYVSEKELKRFLKASAVQEQVARDADSINSTPIIRSVFSYNNSIYFQCLEQNFGTSLDQMHFDTLYDYLEVLIKITEIISQYHQKGWLHLDIKPQNIFCKSSESAISVVMIDFDSLIRSDDILDTSVTLSCSKDYAPPELRNGNRQKIKIQSDFYEIGCILFKKIFGRFPCSTEITGFSKIRFQSIIFPDNLSKELCAALQDFFHHTITVDPSNRYQSDATFLSALQTLLCLSKEKNHRILSNFVPSTGFFTGRQKEINEIRQHLINHRKIIIQGYGGIGKSTVALKYAEKYSDTYQSIVYFEYRGAFEELIRDELQISEVTTSSTVQDKWQIFTSLCSDKTLVILDNLDHMDYPVLAEKWLSLPCHMIVTVRNSHHQFKDMTLSLSGLPEAKELFCHYYCFPLSIEDDAFVNRLLFTINCHPMMTELLGKLCSHFKKNNGKVNFSELLMAFENADTTNMSSENVRELKDWTPTYRSIPKHMDVLFSIFSFSEEEKKILQFISLIPLKSMSEKLFSTWFQNYSYTALELLKGRGVLQTDTQGYLKLHPLTAERVLVNFPPDAKDFSDTTEKISDAISAVNKHTSDTLLRIGAFYAEHLCGASLNLAFLYQILAFHMSANQKELYTEKAKKMYSLVLDGDLPLYFILKPLVEKYISLDMFNDFEQKEELINEIMTFLEQNKDCIPEYRKVNQCEQIAALCHRIAETDMVWMFGEDDSDIEHPLYIYEVDFLETALKYCQSNVDRKRIATTLYKIYSDYCTLLTDSMKAEKYYLIAELDDAEDSPKVYFLNSHTGKYEQSKIELDVERKVQLIDELIMMEELMVNKRYNEALELADRWYEEWSTYDIVDFDHLLDNLFYISKLYWKFGQWSKYIHIAEAVNRLAENNMDWKLAQAYWMNGSHEKCYAYLKNAEKYYAPSFCTELDYEAIKYLLALICLALYYSEEETNAEEKFLSNAELFYHFSLFAKDDDLAEFCLRLAKKYIEVSEKKYASRYFGLYARFRDTHYIEKAEYEQFQKLLSHVTLSGYASVWCQLFCIDSLDFERSSEAISQYEKLLMEPEIDEVYQQFIYNKMINLDEDYVVQHYADKINYELLDEIKLQERREPLSFDQRVRHRIDIAEAYRNIGVDYANDILQQLLSKIHAFSGDVRMKSKALHYLEEYYAEKDDVTMALELSMEQINLYQCESSDYIKNCLDISDYYSKLNDFDKQFEWIQKSFLILENIDVEPWVHYDLITNIHHKLLNYYIFKEDELNQIKEYQELIILEKSSPDPVDFQRLHLQEYYHALSELFLKQHNPTQAYYYSSLEEGLIQERVNDINDDS